ncbi:TPA: hypothetical protein U0J94_001551 [Streptococcus suis]|uniref:hypothetical protein n=1 Tax=Streptococcus suis TaxID=1307 RepID=UPI0009448FDA|nr:hypothetical protein [Streptococcus suis]HEL2343261.1 hypothetical protein [Streptococcus suis]HEL9624127.1 hypothetical protein [Streptococcus suis]HEM3885908.1 hypothetical protein [Streptococcus suis]
MKFYLGDDKRLIVESSWHDRFDYKGEIYVNEPKTKIQLRSNQTEAIEQEIRQAIAGVIKKYQAEMAELPLKDIFDEKRKQIRESYDTEQAVADVIERWQK